MSKLEKISILMAAYNDPSDNRGCQLPYFRGAVYTIKSAIESVLVETSYNGVSEGACL